VGSCQRLFASLAGPRPAGRQRATVLGPRLAGRRQAVAASSVERQRRVIDSGHNEGASSPLQPAAAWGAYAATGCDQIWCPEV
jgi:hypothetical protein